MSSSRWADAHLDQFEWLSGLVCPALSSKKGGFDAGTRSEPKLKIGERTYHCISALFRDLTGLRFAPAPLRHAADYGTAGGDR